MSSISYNQGDVAGKIAQAHAIKAQIEEETQRHLKAYNALASDGAGNVVTSGLQYAQIHKTAMTKVNEAIQQAGQVANTTATSGTDIDRQFGSALAT